MFNRWTRETLRRADIANEHQARWLELRQPPKEDVWTSTQLKVEKFSTSALLWERLVHCIMNMNQR